MEPEGSLLCWQKPATGPYPEPDESILHPHILFLRQSELTVTGTVSRLCSPESCQVFTVLWSFVLKAMFSYRRSWLAYCSLHARSPLHSCIAEERVTVHVQKKMNHPDRQTDSTEFLLCLQMKEVCSNEPFIRVPWKGG